MINNNVTVRKATSDDVTLIAALEGECFSDASGEGAINSLFGMGATFVLAFDGDTLCGFAYAADCVGDAELLRICVCADRRGCGIGRRLLSALHAELLEAGMGSVFLEVRESNAAAISLYSSEGYVMTGRRKRFYKNPTEDALLFTKEL